MISTRYLFRVDTGFLVRKCWELTGFSPDGRRELARNRCAPAARQVYAWVRLISAKNL